MAIRFIKIYNTINRAFQKIGKYLVEENTKSPKIKSTNVLSFLFVVFLVKYRLFVLASIKRSLNSLKVKKTKVVGVIFFCMVSVPVFLVYQPKLENLKNGKHTQATFKYLPKPNVVGLEVSRQNLERFIENFDESLIPKKIDVLLNQLNEESLEPFILDWDLLVEEYAVRLLEKLDSLPSRAQARRFFLNLIVRCCQRNHYEGPLNNFEEYEVMIFTRYIKNSFAWLPFRDRYTLERFMLSHKEFVDIWDYYLTKYDPLLSDYDNLCWSAKDVEYLVDCINANNVFGESGLPVFDEEYYDGGYFVDYPRADPTFAGFPYPIYDEIFVNTAQEELLETRIALSLKLQKEDLFFGNGHFLEFEDDFLHSLSNVKFTAEVVRDLYLTRLKRFLKDRVYNGFIVFSQGFRAPKYHLSLDEYIQVVEYFLNKYDPTSSWGDNLFLFRGDVDFLAAKLGFTLSFPHPVDPLLVYADDNREELLHSAESFVFNRLHRKEIGQVIKAERSFWRENPEYPDTFLISDISESFPSDSGSDDSMGVEGGQEGDRVEENPPSLTTMLYSKWRGKDAQTSSSFFSNPVDPELDNLVSEVDNSPFNLRSPDDLSAEENNLETKPSSIQKRLETDNGFEFFEKNPVFFGIKYPMRRGDNFLLGTPNKLQENSLSFLYRSSICETELDINYILGWYIDLGQKSELLYSNMDWMAEWILLFPQRQRLLFKRCIERNFDGEPYQLGSKEIGRGILWLQTAVEAVAWLGSDDWGVKDWVEDEGWQLDWAERCGGDEEESPWLEQPALWHWYQDELFNFYTGELGTPENFNLGNYLWVNTFPAFEFFEKKSLNNEMSFDWEKPEEVLFDWYEPEKVCLGRKRTDDVLLCFSSENITTTPSLVDKKDYNALITDEIIDLLFPGLDLYRCSSFLPTGKGDYEERPPLQQLFFSLTGENYQTFFDIEELPLTMGIEAYYFTSRDGSAILTREKNLVGFFTDFQSQIPQQLVVFSKEVPSRVFSNLYNYCTFLFSKLSHYIKGLKRSVLEQLIKKQGTNLVPTTTTDLNKKRHPLFFYFFTPEKEKSPLRGTSTLRGTFETTGLLEKDLKPSTRGCGGIGGGQGKVGVGGIGGRLSFAKTNPVEEHNPEKARKDTNTPGNTPERGCKNNPGLFRDKPYPFLTNNWFLGETLSIPKRYEVEGTKEGEKGDEKKERNTLHEREEGDEKDEKGSFLFAEHERDDERDDEREEEFSRFIDEGRGRKSERKAFSRSFFPLVNQKRLFSGKNLEPAFQSGRYIPTPRYSNTSNKSSGMKSFKILKKFFYLHYFVENQPRKPKEMRIFESFYRFIDDNDLFLPIRWKRPSCENYHSPNLSNDDFNLQNRLESGYSPYYEERVVELKIKSAGYGSLYPIRYLHKLRVFDSKYNWYNYYMEKVKESRNTFLYNLSTIFKSIWLVEKCRSVVSQIPQMEKINVYNHYSEDLRHAYQGYNPKASRYREFKLSDFKEIFLDSFLGSKESQDFNPLFKRVRKRVRRKRTHKSLQPTKRVYTYIQRKRGGLPVPLLREVRERRGRGANRDQIAKPKRERGSFTEPRHKLQRSPRALVRPRTPKYVAKRKKKSFEEKLSLQLKRRRKWHKTKRRLVKGRLLRVLRRLESKHPFLGSYVIRPVLPINKHPKYSYNICLEKRKRKKRLKYRKGVKVESIPTAFYNLFFSPFPGKKPNLKTRKPDGVKPGFKLLPNKRVDTLHLKKGTMLVDFRVRNRKPPLKKRKKVRRGLLVDQQFVQGFESVSVVRREKGELADVNRKERKRRKKKFGKRNWQIRRKRKVRYTHRKKSLSLQRKDSRNLRELIGLLLVPAVNLQRSVIRAKREFKELLRFSYYYRHLFVFKDQNLLRVPKRVLPLLLLICSAKLVITLLLLRPVIRAILYFLKALRKTVIKYMKGFRLFDLTAAIEVTKLPPTSLVIKNPPSRLSDLVGYDYMLPELCDIVFDLKVSAFNRKVLRRYNFRKGFLFVGPPGNGKTVLVKALAGQAKVPVVLESIGAVIAAKKHDVNTLQNRVPLKDTFKRAKRVAPCILFIDEIDTIGGEREGVMKVSHTTLWKHLFLRPSLRPTNKNYKKDKKERYYKGDSFRISQKIRKNKNDLTHIKTGRDMLLNKRAVTVLLQLLLELDKLSEKDAVYVIGATNRPEGLDPALTRPGRLSNYINLQNPQKAKRIEILKMHSSHAGADLRRRNQKPLSPKESFERGLLTIFMFFKHNKWEKISQKGFSEIREQTDVGPPDFSSSSWEYFGNITLGFSAADLAAVVEHSTLQAVFQKTNHTIKTFEEGIDYITTYNRREKREKSLAPFAYYQAGKAVIHTLLPLHPDVHVIKIFSRRQNFRSKKKMTYLSNIGSRPIIETRLIGLYAGKAAELLFLSLNYMTLSTPKSAKDSFFSDKKTKTGGSFSDKTSDKRQTKKGDDLFYQNKKPGFQSFLCQTSIGFSDLAAACHITGHIVERLYYSKNIGAELKGQILTSRNTSNYPEFDTFRSFVKVSKTFKEPFCNDYDIADSQRFRAFIWKSLRKRKRLWKDHIEDRISALTAIGRRWNNDFFVEPAVLRAEREKKKIQTSILLVEEQYYHDYLLFDVPNFDRVKGLDSCAERLPRLPKRLDDTKKSEERGSLLKKRETTTQRFTNRRTPSGETRRGFESFSQREKKGRLNLLPKNDDHQTKDPAFSPVSWNELYLIDTDYISHMLIYTSFNQAFCLLDENREVLDYLVDYLLRFEVVRQEKINEILFAFGLPDTTYKNETESGTKNKQTTYVPLPKQKQKFEVLRKLQEKDQNKGKMNSVFAQNWGKGSRRGFSRFFTFNL